MNCLLPVFFHFLVCQASGSHDPGVPCNDLKRTKFAVLYEPDTIPGKKMTGPTEYDLVLASVKEKAEGERLSGLDEGEIQVLSGKTGILPDYLKNLVVADAFQKKWRISRECLYGLFRQNKKASLISLAMEPDMELQSTLKKSQEENIISTSACSGESEFITSLRKAAAGDLLVSGKGTGALKPLLQNAGLNDDEQQVFSEAYILCKSKRLFTWDCLRANTSFSARQLNNIKKMFRLDTLTGHNASLAGLLFKKETEEERISKFVHLERHEWVKLLEENNVEIPEPVTGKTGEEKTRNYADLIYRKFEKAFPGEKLKGKILRNHPGEGLKKFLLDNPDFDFGGMDIEKYLQQHGISPEKMKDESETVEELKVYQRLYKITPDEDKYERIEELKKQDMESADKIIHKPQTKKEQKEE